MVPFGVFRDECEATGITEEKDITSKWRTKILDPKTKTMQFNGETLFYRLEGISSGFVVDNYADNVTSLEGSVSGKTQLADAREAAASLCDDAMTSFQEQRKEYQEEAPDAAKVQQEWLLNEVDLFLAWQFLQVSARTSTCT